MYTPAGRPLPLRGFSAQRSGPLPRVCRSPGEQGQRRTPSGSALRVARAGQSCGYLKSQRDREGTVGVRWCPTPGSHWLCVGLFCTRVLSGNDPASVVWLRLRPRWLRVQSGFCDGLGGQGTDGTLETRAVPQPVMYPAPSPHWTSDTRGVFGQLGPWVSTLSLCWDCHCLPGFHIAGGQGSNIGTSVPCSLSCHAVNTVAPVIQGVGSNDLHPGWYSVLASGDCHCPAQNSQGRRPSQVETGVAQLAHQEPVPHPGSPFPRLV